MNASSTDTLADVASKVPAVTIGFWLIKILATTLGETAGDSVSMTLDFGYLAGTLLFLAPLVLLVWAQVAARRFHPALYWATIIASTTAGTTMADFATRSIGIGYPGGALLLFAGVIGMLLAWRMVLGSIASDAIVSPRAEIFYWATITISQTLGTALGDWVAAAPGDVPPGIGLGYTGGALVFGAALALIAGLYALTAVNRVTLFWAAFIMTRPLGATVGDFLDKPVDHGGLAFSRPLASAVLLALIVLMILVLPRRAGRHPTA